MKKIAFIAALAIAALASCSKSVEEGFNSEIVFQVARHKGVTKADDYKTDYQAVPFGAFAWYKGVSASDNTTFMTNQKVSFSDPVWKPEGTTYYWPKSGSIDFICYSPYTADGVDAPLPTITEDGISYPAWNVGAHPTVDIMYADKVTGLTANSKTYFYDGVPTLFHHALAKVSFQIKQSYMSVTSDTGDTTSWEITVSDIILSDILTSGSLNLTLNPDGTWNKPSVWDTTGGTKENVDLLDSDITLDGTNQGLVSDLMILPQSLTDGQKVTITVTIKTYRDLNDGNGPQLVLTETDIPIEGLLSGGSLDHIGINQNVTYTFNITPSLGSTTDSDGDGVPDDLDGDGIPDMVPTVVYFDPAVDEWENITVNAGINI